MIGSYYKYEGNRRSPWKSIYLITMQKGGGYEKVQMNKRSGLNAQREL